MHISSILAATTLLALSAANPVPATVNAPISDAEWDALRDAGLKTRDAQPATVNQPISDDEWQALKDGGLTRRSDSSTLIARDKTLNCGHRVNGKGGSNGHGKWIPVAQFVEAADRFCELCLIPFCVYKKSLHRLVKPLGRGVMHLFLLTAL